VWQRILEHIKEMKMKKDSLSKTTAQSAITHATDAGVGAFLAGHFFRFSRQAWLWAYSQR
jgi:hypothetical protein